MSFQTRLLMHHFRRLYIDMTIDNSALSCCIDVFNIGISLDQFAVHIIERVVFVHFAKKIPIS